MQHALIRIIIFLVPLVFFQNCANRGNPMGGPIDEDPPQITNSYPENFSVNFKASEIRIYFNEYIKIKNAQKQIIISPPMDPSPVITPLGAASKEIIIKILDTLYANTTYAINFGQSIVDNNEENPFSYYRYVFSTGAAIDSLSVKGSIRDALNLSPDTFVNVMLYEIDSTYTDSTVYKQKPKYITNTLDSLTDFSIDNIKAGRYKLIALKDENGNYTYEPKSDKIGFVGGEITVPKDTSYVIKLFKEVLDFNVGRTKQIGDQRIMFPFQGDYNNTKIEILGSVPKVDDYEITKDEKTDSLYYWYRPKIENDSVFFVVKNKTYIDTLKHKFRKADKDTLVLKPLQTGSLKFDENFTIESTTPITKFDKTKLKVIDKDSSVVPFQSRYDAVFKRYEFPIALEEDNRYEFMFLPGAFTDFFDKQSDTLKYNIRTRKKSEYGNLRVKIENAKFPLIIQLTDNKYQVKYERYIEKSPIVDFNDITPKQYLLRVIFDENGNGKYDPGEYLKVKQPERVSYAQPIDEIRANFDFVVTFTLD